MLAGAGPHGRESAAQAFGARDARIAGSGTQRRGVQEIELQVVEAHLDQRAKGPLQVCVHIWMGGI